MVIKLSSLEFYVDVSIDLIKDPMGLLTVDDVLVMGGKRCCGLGGVISREP